MTKCLTAWSFKDPIKVRDHKWCHVQSVVYFIWVKGEEDKPIDMRNGKSEDRARGTLLPEIHTDNVTKLLNRGMESMRDLFLKFQKDLDIKSAIDHSALDKFVIPPFPVDWALSMFRVMAVVDITAHLCSVNWHEMHFGSAKRIRDLSYAPSESECDGSGSSKCTRASVSTSTIPYKSLSTPVVSSSKLMATATSKSSSKAKSELSKAKSKDRRSKHART
ncbi:hypothetical protein DEU56DRAFT_752451 [Suillus clintonianus]|uniref:uncharacterized protein n=1 Tax=Suillus clintonianus TaxID=1904413 RepID=UPI001B86BEDE|nr:uncharacterized protein DEU56DRAFT_752451 [Suillus clintonianus]KAG2150776.1 hypothetical protein DEU56DRAFT_752451 [Suillus clintonianus]